MSHAPDDDSAPWNPPPRADGCKVCQTAPCECSDNCLVESFLRSRGERPPLVTDGRLMGGNGERLDRGDPVQKRKDLIGRVDHAAARALFLTECHLRFESLTHWLRSTTAYRKRVLAERVELARDVRLLRMHAAGATEKEIALAFGRRSHSWASERLAEIDAAILVQGVERLAGNVGKKCALEECQEIVKRFRKNGSPALYHEKRCQRIALHRRWDEKRKAARQRAGNAG